MTCKFDVPEWHIIIYNYIFVAIFMNDLAILDKSYIDDLVVFDVLSAKSYSR